MKVIVFMVVLLTTVGCKSMDVRRDTAHVVKTLSTRFDLSNVAHEIEIVHIGNEPAFFHNGGAKIYLKWRSARLLRHELAEFYLWQLKIPSSDRHKVMKDLNLY